MRGGGGGGGGGASTIARGKIQIGLIGHNLWKQENLYHNKPLKVYNYERWMQLPARYITQQFGIFLRFQLGYFSVFV